MGSEGTHNKLPPPPPIHLFLVSFPGQGHVNPLLRLGKRLASTGLLVTFTTTEPFFHSIQKSNSNITRGSLLPIGSGSLRFDFINDEWSPDDPRRQDLDLYLSQLETVGRRRVPEMLRILTNQNLPPVTCLINNPFIPWVTDVAAELGLPSAMLWVQSCTCFLSYYYYANSLVPFPTEHDPYADVHIPTLPTLKWDEIPSFLHPTTPYPFLRRAILGQYRNLDKPFCVLMDTFDDLERESIQFASTLCPVKAVGPLYKDPTATTTRTGTKSSSAVRGDQMKADGRCLEWLGTKPERSVVYISFGTVVFLKQEQVDEIAHALMGSEISFLWVMKPPHPDGGEKPHVLPDGFFERVGDKGRVVEYSPQEEVLAHRSVACFVTHCGWNSTMEAVSSGVPVVAFPQWGDQVTDAKFLVEVLGVGVRMCRGAHEEKVVGREEVERCLREATVGEKAEEMRKRAAVWKEKAERAGGVGGSSVVNLEEFVEEVVRRSKEVVVQYEMCNGRKSTEKETETLAAEVVVKEGEKVELKEDVGGERLVTSCN